MSDDAKVCITEEQLAYYRALEERVQQHKQVQRAYVQRYVERNLDTIRAKSRERRKVNYEKIKADPARLQEVRLQQYIALAKVRLQKQGYLTSRTNPEVIAALPVHWDATTNKWLPAE